MNKTLLILGSFLSTSFVLSAQNRPGSESRPATGQTVTISSFTQAMKKHDGYFDFYYDDKNGKVYLEIDKLDTEFLYFTSLVNGVGNGNAERGQASSNIVKFTKIGPKIFLIMPVTDYRAVNGNADEIKAVEQNFAKSVLFAFTPVATEGSTSLVDITSFIVRDVMHVGDNLGSARNPGSPGGRGAATSGGGYRLDNDRSVVYMDNTKNFPKNTEFEAMLTFAGSGRGRLAPDNTSVTLNEHQAFVELPPLVGFKMRKFDPRSGFFAFDYLDFAAPMSEPINKKFTERHRLAKKDPSAAVSEAAEPIVYYIDRGAHPVIKKALMEGGAWWNQAFEAAGYKNAFIVKELPEGADPMDIRYNVVNWVTRSGSPTRAFSYGAAYTDPRTGEIIKGVVTLGSDRHREDFLIAEGLLQPYTDGKPIPKQMEEMALARIRQLSAHEIGHTLGLTHNFAASFKDRASVMDYPYPRFDLKADGTIDLSNAYAKGIGTWDKRAIIWGYSDFAKGVDEDAALDKIMKQTLAEGHQYIPDIGGYAHPMSNQWEDGTNPIDQLNKLMKVRRHVLDTFSEKAIQKDAPMATLNEVLVPMYLLHRYQVEAVAKWIGGLYFTHALKNDSQVPTKMVDPADQWRAFDALMATITPDALALPEDLIKKIPPRPEGYPGTVEIFDGKTGPTFDPISAAESAAGATLNNLLMSDRAARIIEFNARDPKNPSLLAVIDKLLDQTWKTPLQSGYKGELQILVNNMVLKKLLGLAADIGTGENVRGEALLKVTELKDWMSSRIASTQGKQKGALLFGLQQIAEFEKDPNKFQPAPMMQMPPGAPIGMPDRAFEVFERY